MFAWILLFSMMKFQQLKILKNQKIFKKSDDSWLRNYWNKIKYKWLNNWEIYIYKKWVTFKKIIHGYNYYWKESKDLKPTN